MSTKHVKGVRHWASVAVRLATQLVGQLGDGPRGNPARTATVFARLRRVMRALPPNHILSANFEPNMTLWPSVWRSGEYAAALYQAVQLVRRLRRYRDDWPATAVVQLAATDSAQ
jgi:hypothetical protein